MTNRALVVLLALVAALVALRLAFPERRPAPAVPLLPGSASGSLPDSLRLTFDERSVILRRAAAGSWSRDGQPLDESAVRTVEAFARGLGDLGRGVRVAGATAGDLAAYGLAPARVAVTFWFGDRATDLRLGDESPLGREVYAIVSEDGARDDEVFLVTRGVSLLVEQVGRQLDVPELARRRDEPERETR